MLLAGKAACSGIVFILLTIGVSGPRPTPLALGAYLPREVPAVRNRNDVRKLCRTKDTTAGRSMASSVSEPGRAFADFRRLRIYRSQVRLICRRPTNSESGRVARRLATRLRKVNLRQA